MAGSELLLLEGRGGGAISLPAAAAAAAPLAVVLDPLPQLPGEGLLVHGVLRAAEVEGDTDRRA